MKIYAQIPIILLLIFPFVVGDEAEDKDRELKECATTKCGNMSHELYIDCSFMCVFYATWKNSYIKDFSEVFTARAIKHCEQYVCYNSTGKNKISCGDKCVEDYNKAGELYCRSDQCVKSMKLNESMCNAKCFNSYSEMLYKEIPTVHCQQEVCKKLTPKQKNHCLPACNKHWPNLKKILTESAKNYCQQEECKLSKEKKKLSETQTEYCVKLCVKDYPNMKKDYPKASAKEYCRQKECNDLKDTSGRPMQTYCVKSCVEDYPDMEKGFRGKAFYAYCRYERCNRTRTFLSFSNCMEQCDFNNYKDFLHADHPVMRCLKGFCSSLSGQEKKTCLTNCFASNAVFFPKEIDGVVPHLNDQLNRSR